jgi:hypothetical protein
MDAKVCMQININEERTPRHDEYVEYEKRNEIKQVFKSLLVNAALELAATGKTTKIDDLVQYSYADVITLSKPSWTYWVDEDAREVIKEYATEIAEYAIENDGEISNDPSDYARYMDDRIRECEPGSMSSEDAIELLSNLIEYEDDDEGLWEGVTEWWKILEIKAHYTYQNAVYDEVTSMLSELNATIYVEDTTEEILVEIMTEEDYADMKTQELDRDNFDDIVEYCLENKDDFEDIRLQRIADEINSAATRRD